MTTLVFGRSSKSDTLTNFLVWVETHRPYKWREIKRIFLYNLPHTAIFPPDRVRAGLNFISWHRGGTSLNVSIDWFHAIDTVYFHPSSISPDELRSNKRVIDSGVASILRSSIGIDVPSSRTNILFSEL